MKKILLIPLFLAACTPQNDTPCSSSQAALKECITSNPTNALSTLLDISYADSNIYDANQAKWNQIASSELTSGKINSNIILYSNLMNTSLDAAITSASNAETQRANGTTEGANGITYIKFVAKSGVAYTFKYRKYKKLWLEKKGKI